MCSGPSNALHLPHMKRIEDFVPVSESKIWSLQNHFYETKGIEAWDENIVPSGPTTNCYIADTYASMIAAFIRDCASLPEPVLVIEAGGGNGLLASRIIHRLQSHLRESATGNQFEYLLTDGADSNLEHWREIPRFRRLQEQGVLKLGTLWVDSTLEIRTESGVITEKDLGNRPVVVISNYLHGTIPCHLYRVQDGNLAVELVSLHERDEASMGESDGNGIFYRTVPEFRSKQIDEPSTGHAVVDDILRDYKQLSGNRCIPVPLTSIHFLEIFLRRQAPFLSLSGDLGYVNPEDFRSNPPFILEDYFAYYTNLHMMAEVVDRAGGQHWFPRCRDRMFICGAFSKSDIPLPQTSTEARIRLQDYPPFDSYAVQKMVENTDKPLPWREMGSWLRASRYDPELAAKFLEDISEIIVDDPYHANKGLSEALIESVYMAFPSEDDDFDLDVRVTHLLLQLRLNEKALELIQYGIEEFESCDEIDADRYYYAALASVRLEHVEQAVKYLESCLDVFPEHEKAERLQEKLAPAAVA